MYVAVKNQKSATKKEVLSPESTVMEERIMRSKGSESGGDSRISLLSKIYVNSRFIEPDLGYITCQTLLPRTTPTLLFPFDHLKSLNFSGMSPSHQVALNKCYSFNASSVSSHVQKI